MDDVRIDEEDIAVFRKVLAYYYLCDAFIPVRRLHVVPQERARVRRESCTQHGFRHAVR